MAGLFSALRAVLALPRDERRRQEDEIGNSSSAVHIEQDIYALTCLRGRGEGRCGAKKGSEDKLLHGEL